MNRLFSILFLSGSMALLLGSWWHVLPFSFIEDLGFITGALTVWLAVIENIWTFPVGIANDLFFFVLFFEARFFADMGLHLIYIFLSVQGWYAWLRGGKDKSVLQISNIPKKELFFLLLVLLPTTYPLMIYLQHIEDASPFWDAFSTVLSLIAQYMLNKKYRQSWYCWVLVDSIYIPFYLSRQLYLTSVVYLIFLCLSLLGLRAWSQDSEKKAEKR